MSNNSHQNFDTLSTEGILTLEQLKIVLGNELIALSDRDIDSLSLFNSEKNILLQTFQDNVISRNTLLSTQEYENSREGVSMFLASCIDPELRKKMAINWALLETQLKDTMLANKTNEQALNRNLKNITTVLSILQGKSAANILYDAKGDKGDFSSQSRIGKA